MDELDKLLENAGMVTEAPNPSREESQYQHMMRQNQDKIVKTLIGTAHALDKADRPGVTNPSKANVSVYINHQIEDVIDALQQQGYNIDWEEKGWGE